MEVLIQDNDTWQPLNLAVGRLLVKLSENHHPDSKRDASEDERKREKASDHDKAVEQGLRQIERFERRYRRAD
jgi:hypothetical protein